MIKELTIYGHNGKNRTIFFHDGLNIITGDNSTGKSAVGKIIEYCMGSDNPGIPQGEKFEKIKQYGLLLKFGEESLFVARDSPNKDSKSKHSYYAFGVEKSPCDMNSLIEINTEQLIALLSGKLGIIENYTTYRKWDANIKHTFAFLFQNQTEIASEKLLFHNSHDQHYFDAIRLTLPYFLGIYTREVFSKEREIDDIKKQIKKLELKKEAKGEILSQYERKAHIIYNQMYDNGMVSERIVDDDCFWEIMGSALQNKSDVFETNSDSISQLQINLRNKEDELRAINHAIDEINDLLKVVDGYVDEKRNHQFRLRSIGVFSQYNQCVCPICKSGTIDNNETIKKIRSSLQELDTQLMGTSQNEIKIQHHLDDLNSSRSRLRAEIRAIKNDLSSTATETYLNKNTEYTARYYELRGQLSLIIDSKNDACAENVDEEIDNLKAKLEFLSSYISEEITVQKRESVLKEISAIMTEYAKQMKSTNDGKFSIDLNKLIVFVELKDKKYSMRELGGGYEWLCCHISSLFAIHKYMLDHGCPVPNFIFLDQPSLVNSGGNEIDMAHIRQVFSQINTFIQENEKLQVIISEHVNLNMPQDMYFQDAIVEDWWESGGHLIPNDW